MASKDSLPFSTIQIHPLTGTLDARSRPADLPFGAFRYKLSMAITTDGKMCRRAGHDRFFSDFSPYTNHDHHRRGRTRKPPTFLYQCQDNNGVRHLFDGTESELSKLNYTTGEWTDLLTGVGASQARWRADILQDKVFFTNNVDNVFCYDLDTAMPVALPELTSASPGGVGITAAKVVMEYQGVIFVMNVVQDGKRNVARVVWSDLNDGTSWSVSLHADSIAGFEDLDSGDPIIAAGQCQGALYIFTRNAIWRVTVSGTDSGSFFFKRVYCEPENQAKCLAYENTLASTGSEFYYLGRETAYTYNPYLSEPQRADQGQTDWLHKAVGVIYRSADTKLDPNFCLAPVARFVPITRELWFSWATVGRNGVNNWSLAGHVDQRTADLVDTGYTAFINERRNSTAPDQCNEEQDFLGASGRDYAIKSIGGVFLREWVLVGPDVTADIPDPPVYYDEGYNSVLRGQFPTGYNDREKIIRSVLIDDDTTAQDVPPVVKLRIANAPTNVDPNDQDDVCAPMWKNILVDLKKNGTFVDGIPLACQDTAKISVLQAAGMRSDSGIKWPCYEQGKFLYFELTIVGADGGPALGGDTCWSRIDFEAMALPKP